jgi:hypothetical protein
MRIIELTPPQIISIFGWFNLKPFLAWCDVENTPKMTFRSLRDAGVTPTQLHTIQPDVEPWMQHASITLHDCVEMTLWPAHPIHVLKADLADIISMRWTPDQMRSLGINVDELIQLGMIAELMTLFVYPLASWVTIGLTQKHVANMTDVEILRVFRMGRVQVLCSTPNVTVCESMDNKKTKRSGDILNDEATHNPRSLIRPIKHL